jgi:hypothetical protein
MPVLGGLSAAAVVSEVACRAPLRPVLSWHVVLVSAAGGVAAAFIAGACGDSVFRLVSSGVLFDRRETLHTACLAVWLAPLSLFLQERSFLAMALAAALAGTAVLSLTPAASEDDDAPQRAAALFAEQVFVDYHARPLARELFPALCVVTCAEAAVVAQVAGHGLLAAALSAAGAAVLAHGIALRVLPPKRQWITEERARSLTINLPGLALLVTMAALLPFLARGFGFGSRSAKSRLPFTASSTGPPGHDRVRTGGYSHPGAPSDAPGDLEGYSGIILWPKKQQVVKLVAPPAVSPAWLTLGAPAAAPLSIPFDGVYWVFKLPDSRPPRRSHEAKGSPEEFNIRSTDDRPLQLEAHQNLGALIDLTCCRAIQVAIRNADRYPGTVSLELLLRDTTLPGKPSRFLGTSLVSSTRPWSLYGDRPAVSEILNFAIPEGFPLRRFDEVTVVFQLSPDRASFGARMAIEKFTLIPRGEP